MKTGYNRPYTAVLRRTLQKEHIFLIIYFMQLLLPSATKRAFGFIAIFPIISSLSFTLKNDLLVKMFPPLDRATSFLVSFCLWQPALTEYQACRIQSEVPLKHFGRMVGHSLPSKLSSKTAQQYFSATKSWEPSSRGWNVSKLIQGFQEKFWDILGFVHPN